MIIAIDATNIGSGGGINHLNMEQSSLIPRYDRVINGFGANTAAKQFTDYINDYENPNNRFPFIGIRLVRTIPSHNNQVIERIKKALNLFC